MGIRIDPEKYEVRALESIINWRGKRVLEIGCGEGRLTQRLAMLGADVNGIDPDPKSIRRARTALPGRFATSICFRTGSAERLSYPDERFDLVVFAWSL